MDASAGAAMSTIGSDYSAHRRSLDELEGEYEASAKKAKEREKTREAKLEQNMKSVVRKKDAELESAVRSVKDEYESSLKAQAKSDLAERNRLQKNVYDRSGRRSSAIEEAARTDRDRALEAAATAQARAAKATSDAESYHEKQAEERAARHEKELEAVVENYRKQIAEARSEDGDGESTQQYREKLQKDAQLAIQQAREEVMMERRQAQKLAEQSHFTLKNREKKADHLLHTRLREKDVAVQAALRENAEADRTSRALELQPLREQIMETAQMKREAQSQWNRGRQEAIRDLESEWNSKYANQTLSHDLEKQKLKADNADTERFFGQKLGSFIKEKDAKTAQLVADQNSEHRDQLGNASKEYDRSLEHVKLQATREKEMSQSMLERERAVATERQNSALERQGATYQKTMANQRLAQQTQIENLERVLNRKNSTDDPGEISSAAEQSVRNAVTRQYDRVFQAEADRNARARAHLKDNYQAKLDDSRSDNQSLAAKLTRQNMSEQTAMRDTFVQHVTDVEENKRQMLMLANESNAKMADESLRNHERTTNEMQRHYEELIATRDMENSTRMQEVRTQAEFEKRGMRRDFQAQTADMVRAYEKKLSDQKVESDEQLRDLKAKLDSQGREQDRRLKQALADQARSYEHRLAESEAQSRDRERMYARNHEEELDKVKKANALLLSKKG